MEIKKTNKQTNMACMAIKTSTQVKSSALINVWSGLYYPSLGQ